MLNSVSVFSVDLLMPDDNRKLAMHRDAIKVSSFLNFKSKYSTNYSEPIKISVLFTDEKDAMWFKLKWA